VKDAGGNNDEVVFPRVGRKEGRLAKDETAAWTEPTALVQNKGRVQGGLHGTRLVLDGAMHIAPIVAPVDGGYTDNKIRLDVW